MCNTQCNQCNKSCKKGFIVCYTCHCNQKELTIINNSINCYLIYKRRTLDNGEIAIVEAVYIYV